jgi:outer membrane protein assembly factor BamB
MSRRRNVSPSSRRLLGLAAAALAVALGTSCSQGGQGNTERLGIAKQALLSVNWLTRSYDRGRTGANTSEFILTQANVGTPGYFGKLFDLAVDDQVYAQPLYVSAVSMPAGTHNVVYVATTNNTVYAFDADTGQQLWVNNYNKLVDTVNGDAPRDTNVSAGASGWGCGPGYQDFSPTVGNSNAKIGIVGTPVIDGSSNTLYVVTHTIENAGGTITQAYRLLSIDITSGALNRWLTMDATIWSSFQNQRAGLALANGRVYVAFASYGDCETSQHSYGGWMFSTDAATFVGHSWWVSTPNGHKGGIWQSGNAPAIDSSGNVYIATGNGDWSPATQLGNSVVELSPALNMVTYFTPDRVGFLNGNDLDLGSSAPVLFGNLLAQCGKEGVVYLLDSGPSLGGRLRNDAQIRQTFNGADMTTQPSLAHNIHNGPVVWADTTNLNLYVWGENGHLQLFRYDVNAPNNNHTAGGQFNRVPFATGTYLPPVGMPGGIMSLSAAGGNPTTGIVWATTPHSGPTCPQSNCNANHATVPGRLDAFNAETLAPLWSSTTNAGDDLGSLAKFNPPMVANGKVYVGTFSNKVSVYGPRKHVRGDYIGEGKAQMTVWRPIDTGFPGNGVWYTRYPANQRANIRPFGAVTDVPVPADYDGDGITDPAVWRPDTANVGDWFIAYSGGRATYPPTQFGTGGDVPVPADYDGDGKADIAVWRPNDPAFQFHGMWYIQYSGGGSPPAIQWGEGQFGDVPVPADYDGDGRADIAVWRPGDGNWYVIDSSTGQLQNPTPNLGIRGDMAAPADYDGDGKTDIAVWRPSDASFQNHGIWRIQYSRGQSPSPIQWGEGSLGDVPAPADYDGDGKADLAVWRPGQGSWHIIFSLTGSQTTTLWGTAGDIVPLNVEADAGCRTQGAGCNNSCIAGGDNGGYCPYSDAHAASGNGLSCFCF